MVTARVSSVGEGSGGGARLTVDVPHSFEATAVDVIGYVTSDADEHQAGAADQPVAEVTALVGGERLAIGRLLAGSGGDAFRTAGLQPAFAGSGEVSVVFRDGETGQEEYLARFTLPEATRPEQLEISLVERSCLHRAGGAGGYAHRRAHQYIRTAASQRPRQLSARTQRGRQDLRAARRQWAGSTGRECASSVIA